MLARSAGTAAAKASFDAPVAAVTTDNRPRAVPNEMISQAIVRLLDGDRVGLDTAAFMPRPGGEEQLIYFARNQHDHISASAANIDARGAAPFLDRSVRYDGLSMAEAVELEALARALATRALLEVNVEQRNFSRAWRAPRSR